APPVMARAARLRASWCTPCSRDGSGLLWLPYEVSSSSVRIGSLVRAVEFRGLSWFAHLREASLRQIGVRLQCPTRLEAQHEVAQQERAHPKQGVAYGAQPT